MSFRRTKPVSLARLRALWADDRLTCAQIAAELDRSERSLGALARQLGLPRRRLGQKTPVDDALLRRLWLAGIGNREIGALFGRHGTTITSHARRLGLPVRAAGHPPRMTLAEYLEAELARSMAEAAARTRAEMQRRALADRATLRSAA